MPKLPPPSNLRTGFKKTPLDLTIEPGVGWFGYMQTDDDGLWLPVLQWTHCRDIFQDVSDSSLSLKGMWYCHGKCSSAESVCAFIERVEAILDLREKSIFRKTPYPEILWIKPSPFWIHDFVRRSFFTLCLRCGMRYKRMKDNFEYCMYEHYQISRDTGPAIRRFLKGYTFYPYDDPEFNTMGWHFIFHDYKTGPINGPELEKLLVKG
jgi:hypothetical protein